MLAFVFVTAFFTAGCACAADAEMAPGASVEAAVGPDTAAEAPAPAETPDPAYRKPVGEAHTAGGTLRVYVSFDAGEEGGQTVYTAANVWIECGTAPADDASAQHRTNLSAAARTASVSSAAAGVHATAILPQKTQILQYCFDLSELPAHFAPFAALRDMNADGSDDLLIFTGCYGAQETQRYACYLYTDAGYAYLPGYEEIPNPVPLADGGLVLSSWQEDPLGRVYAKYVLSAEGIVMTARLALREENGETRCTEERLTGGILRVAREDAALSELDAAYWNIDDPVWAGETD